MHLIVSASLLAEVSLSRNPEAWVSSATAELIRSSPRPTLSHDFDVGFEREQRYQGAP